jgi:hypothetical protein
MVQQWNDFKRALRKDDREAFEALVKSARMHASASTYAISVDPSESAFLSMLLEHEKELMRLRKALREDDGDDAEDVVRDGETTE